MYSCKLSTNFLTHNSFVCQWFICVSMYSIWCHCTCMQGQVEWSRCCRSKHTVSISGNRFPFILACAFRFYYCHIFYINAYFSDWMTEFTCLFENSTFFLEKMFSLFRFFVCLYVDMRAVSCLMHLKFNIRWTIEAIYPCMYVSSHSCQRSYSICYE